MFEIEVVLPVPGAPKAQYSSMTIDEIYDHISIEGHLTVSLNEQIVFSEDIAAVEIYWYLAKWYRAGGIKRKVPFRYTTVEWVGPILTFSYCHGDHWRVDSPWIKGPASPVVEEYELESQVQKLIGHLAGVFEPDHTIPADDAANDQSVCQ